MRAIRKFRYRLSLTHLRDPITWWRHRRLLPSDTFLASYPRSGNTWLRFLLAECLTMDESGFDNINSLIPEIGLQGRAVPLLPGSGRLIKTHEPFRPEYGKAIYLVRDVRDVMLSNYSRAQELGLIDGLDLDAFSCAFAQGTLARVGPWQDHVKSWLESPLMGTSNLLLVRFEDLRSDTTANLTRILEFLGAPMDARKVAQAITNNCLARMRDKEDRSRSLQKSFREVGRFVGKGSVGGWRYRLSPHQVETVESCASRELMRLGYDTTALSATPKPLRVG